MFGLAHSLSRIARFKAQAAVEERHAAELIDLKLRDCEAQVRDAKRILASLIVRHRAESGAVERLRADIRDLEARTTEAMEANSYPLAEEGAEAIASLEVQLKLRAEGLHALDERIAKTKRSLERSNRRMIELRQGAVAAKAMVAAKKAGRSLTDDGDAFSSAEDLIARISGGPDPEEEAEALAEVEASLSADGTRARMARAGYGAATTVTAQSVLDRLREKAAAKTQDMPATAV